jgi:hypothetical protein
MSRSVSKFLSWLPATNVLTYLSDPSLKQLYGGEFLHRILEAIVNPPTFWNTLCKSHYAGILYRSVHASFAWLLLEIFLVCTLTTEQFPDVQDVAERVTKTESLINSASLDVRNLG